MPFSTVNKGEGWFWCSLVEGNEPIGPFPSQEEAEKDARATLGIEPLSRTDHAAQHVWSRVRTSQPRIDSIW
jgi:hypothetical protein